MSSPEYDLTAADGVSQYLENTPFASTTVTKLAGGIGNFTFRLHLRAPHKGQPTLILKHAKPYLAVAKDIAFPVERQDAEVEALRRVRSALGNEGKVTVPAVHLFDKDVAVIVMDDAGADSRTLKDVMLARALPAALADEIGGALGGWLARLHAWDAGATLAAPTAFAKEISAWATYGRLVETLGGKSGLAALENPPLAVAEEKLGAASGVAGRRAEEMVKKEEGLVMGDFWPGNILLRLADGVEGVRLEQILVVDWELAKPGLPGLDVGQFVAEVHLLARFHEERCKEPAGHVISSFVKAYGAVTPFDPALANVAGTHVGAHLVTRTPRVAWGGKERVREVVEEGVDLLVDGGRGTDGWTAETFIERMLR